MGPYGQFARLERPGFPVDGNMVEQNVVHLTPDVCCKVRGKNGRFTFIR